MDPFIIACNGVWRKGQWRTSVTNHTDIATATAAATAIAAIAAIAAVASAERAVVGVRQRFSVEREEAYR